MAPQRLLVLAAVLVLLGPAVQAQSNKCCHSFQGTPYSDCKCLEDDKELLTETVAAGQYVNYHWRLTNWALIDVPDDQRPSVTFRLMPCTGNAWLFVTPVVGPPFPTNATARWASRKESEVQAITSKIYYGEYFVSVYGVEKTNYTLIAVVDETIDPVLGDNATVGAAPKIDNEEILFEGDLMAMIITWTTADREAEYKVFASPLRNGDAVQAAVPCGKKGHPGACIQSTYCGLRDGPAVAKSDWIKLKPNTLHAQEVSGLEQNQEYTFNVVARTSANRTLAYVATTGTPLFTRVEQLNDDSTIMIVVASVGGLFCILVACIIWAKSRLNKAYQVKRFGAKKAVDFTPVAGGGAADGKAAPRR